MPFNSFLKDLKILKKANNKSNKKRHCISTTPFFCIYYFNSYTNSAFLSNLSALRFAKTTL